MNKWEYNKYLFAKYQKFLLKIANNYFGRRFLRVVTPELIDGKEVVKITPNGIAYEKDGIGKMDFYATQRLTSRVAWFLEFCEIFSFADYFKTFRYLGAGLTLLFLFHLVPLHNLFPLVAGTTGVYNPNADGSGSGALIRFTGYPGDFTNSTAQLTVQASSEIRTDSSAYIWRCFWPIDTSGLPDAATVSALQFSVYRNDNDGFSNNVSGGMSAHVIPQSQASNTTLATTDYGSITRTSKGSIAYSATSNGAYFDINISDLSFVNLSGYTKVGLITSSDLNQSAPSGGQNVLSFATASDGSHPPKLTVTYTATAIKSVNGLAEGSVKSANGLARASVKSINGLV